MMDAEVIVKLAAQEFRAEFESNLRQRLLDVATAEIEQIVREVADRVFVTVDMYTRPADRTTVLGLHTTFRSKS